LFATKNSTRFTNTFNQFVKTLFFHLKFSSITRPNVRRCTAVRSPCSTFE
jgi:hypothetical protein